MPETVLPYAGSHSRVPLRSPSGVLVQLGPVGDQKVVAWEPEDRRQQELEIRARIVGCSAGLGEVPIVRWSQRIGHAQVVWPEPAQPLAVIAGTPFEPYSLPARGMCWRVNARELYLTFGQAPAPVGPPIDSVQLQVSVQPCLGMHSPLVPYSHAALAVAGVQQPFPMEAREWRLCDVTGLPLVLGAIAVTFAGVSGLLFGPIDGSLVADWRPIPEWAAGWLPSAPCFAVFR